MGPSCPLQAQTVTHCLVPELCQPLGWVFVGTSCAGALGVCRWGPSQAHFWGVLGHEAVQELELTAVSGILLPSGQLCWEYKAIPTSPGAATSL